MKSKMRRHLKRNVKRMFDLAGWRAEDGSTDDISSKLRVWRMNLRHSLRSIVRVFL